MLTEVKAAWESGKFVLQAGVLGVLLVVLLLQNFALKDRELEISRLNSEILVMQRDSAQRLAAAHVKARQSEQALADRAAKSQQEIQTYEKALARQRTDLLARVRAAEERARGAGMPQASKAPDHAEAPSGDPGAELLGTIGSEHVEEAVRADLIRKHLIQCYAQYDDARRILNE